MQGHIFKYTYIYFILYPPPKNEYTFMVVDRASLYEFPLK